MLMRCKLGAATHVRWKAKLLYQPNVVSRARQPINADNKGILLFEGGHVPVVMAFHQCPFCRFRFVAQLERLTGIVNMNHPIREDTRRIFIHASALHIAVACFYPKFDGAAAAIDTIELNARIRLSPPLKVAFATRLLPTLERMYNLTVCGSGVTGGTNLSESQDGNYKVVAPCGREPYASQESSTLYYLEVNRRSKELGCAVAAVDHTEAAVAVCSCFLSRCYELSLLRPEICGGFRCMLHEGDNQPGRFCIQKPI